MNNDLINAAFEMAGVNVMVVSYKFLGGQLPDYLQLQAG